MPRFSVIIPAHNAENRLSIAVNSVLQQSYKDYELIIICDACTDDTYRIASSLTDKVYVTDYGNDGMARNCGLDHATGDWILFMDDDDWWLHEFAFSLISRQIDIWGKGGMDILVFSFIFRYVGLAMPHGNRGYYYPNVWSKCWRREFIGEHRFQNVFMESDYRFCLDMQKLSPKIICYEQPLYYYNYMREGSLTEVASHDSKTVS